MIAGDQQADLAANTPLPPRPLSPTVSAVHTVSRIPFGVLVVQETDTKPNRPAKFLPPLAAIRQKTRNEVWRCHAETPPLFRLLSLAEDAPSDSVSYERRAMMLGHQNLLIVVDTPVILRFVCPPLPRNWRYATGMQVQAERLTTHKSLNAPETMHLRFRLDCPLAQPGS